MNYISKRKLAMLSVDTCAGLIILCSLLAQINIIILRLIHRTNMIAIMVLIIASCITCIMIITISKARDEYEALSMFYQDMIENKLDYYRLKEEKQQEIRSLYHDIKNHTACIQMLLYQENYKALEEYLNQWNNEINNFRELLSTGSNIVDVILNGAQSKYGKDRIEIILIGGMPREHNIASTDLCVIFANIVNNAAEAILRMKRTKDETSIIEINIRSVKNDIFIDATNPVGKTINIEAGEYITSKDNKTLHGFGLKNITKRVKKYDGTTKYYDKNGIFHVEIHMKMHMKNKN